MTFIQTRISGLHIFEPRVHEDDRGQFFESFRTDECLHETGFSFNVAQVNTSSSRKGVLRGVHYKVSPPGQAKFVTVAAGSTIDFVIDLRRHSETFLQWEIFELSSENRKSVLIEYGLGHAFLSLENETRVTYLCDSPFEPDLEYGINPLTVGFDWIGHNRVRESGIDELILSHKDRAAPTLNAFEMLLESS